MSRARPYIPDGCDQQGRVTESDLQRAIRENELRAKLLEDCFSHYGERLSRSEQFIVALTFGASFGVAVGVFYLAFWA